MTEKFQNKYRISSTRLQNWDYGSDAAYFVTICTQNREHYFGEITNGTMQFYEIGLMANKFWFEIPNHFPFVELDEFVVMTNHIYGIIIINKSNNERTVETPNLGVSASNQDVSTSCTSNLGVSTSNLDISITTMASKKWKPAPLGVIINQYKRICTINARKIHADFAWQSRFHDHIIRNDQSFQKIKDYINNNPQTWDDDKFRKEQ